MNLPLPKETRDYFGSDKNSLLKISNLGLLFSKYFYCWPQNWQTNEEQNKVFRKDIEGITSKINLPKGSDYVEALNSRQRAVIESLQNSNWHVEPFPAITDSRLIIGLGGTSVIETGMTLHPLYGFPYLPGSGLKGLARAYAEIGCNAPKEELLEIFGSEDKSQHSADNRQGKVFFMDGLPTAFPKLDLDIMNPHYSDYYSGKKDSKGNPSPPADYLNPVPVTFLAVAPNQPFSFAVFSRDKELAEQAKSWLIGGLTDLGAGGKTNVGYGYFKVDGQKTAGTQTAVQRLAVTQQLSTAPETLIWEDAFLTWSPGNQILKATKDNQKAELKVTDRNIVPEHLRETLFTKKKSVTAKVTVEKTGNGFKIIGIS